MGVFRLRDDVVDCYDAYVRSFLTIADPEIAAFVEQRLAEGHLWPPPRASPPSMSRGYDAWPSGRRPRRRTPRYHGSSDGADTDVAALATDDGDR